MKDFDSISSWNLQKFCCSVTQIIAGTEMSTCVGRNCLRVNCLGFNLLNILSFGGGVVLTYSVWIQFYVFSLLIWILDLTYLNYLNCCSVFLKLKFRHFPNQTEIKMNSCVELPCRILSLPLSSPQFYYPTLPRIVDYLDPLTFFFPHRKKIFTRKETIPDF